MSNATTYEIRTMLWLIFSQIVPEGFFHYMAVTLGLVSAFAGLYYLWKEWRRV